MNYQKGLNSLLILQGSIHSDWNSIPKIWPKLEMLYIAQCATGLTMSMVSNIIIPQLTKLKAISVPDKITKNDPLAASIWEDVNNHPVKAVRFYFLKDDGCCQFLSDVDEESLVLYDFEEESSDEEQETSEVNEDSDVS